MEGDKAELSLIAKLLSDFLCQLVKLRARVRGVRAVGIGILGIHFRQAFGNRPDPDNRVLRVKPGVRIGAFVMVRVVALLVVRVMCFVIVLFVVVALMIVRIVIVALVIVAFMRVMIRMIVVLVIVVAVLCRLDRVAIAQHRCAIDPKQPNVPRLARQGSGGLFHPRSQLWSDPDQQIGTIQRPRLRRA